MTNNVYADEFDRLLKGGDSAMCRHCGEHAFDCCCADELYERSKDREEECAREPMK